MAKIKLWVDPKKCRKDGTGYIYAILHVDYKTVKLNTGILVNTLKKEWDQDNEKISGYTKEAKKKNMALTKVVSGINDIIIDFHLKGIKLTAKTLINEFSNPTNRMDFHKFNKLPRGRAIEVLKRNSVFYEKPAVFQTFPLFTPR